MATATIWRMRGKREPQGSVLGVGETVSLCVTQLLDGKLVERPEPLATKRSPEIFYVVTGTVVGITAYGRRTALLGEGSMVREWDTGTSVNITSDDSCADASAFEVLIECSASVLAQILAPQLPQVPQLTSW